MKKMTMVLMDCRVRGAFLLVDILCPGRELLIFCCESVLHK